MSDRDELARAAAAADPATLLPQRHHAEATRLPGPLVLRDSVDLAEGIVLLLVEDAAGIRYPVPAVSDGLGLRRAQPGDGAALALAATLGRSGTDGTYDAAAPRSDTAPGGFTFVGWHTAPVDHERAIDVDQSNDSLVVEAVGDGPSGVVKWIVRSAAGPHPAPDRIARLVGAGFEAMPRPWGMVLWSPGPGAPAELVASAVDLVPGAQDGWTWAVEDVRSHARGQIDLAAAVAPAERLGTVVAEMHVALADPEPPLADELHTTRWRDDALAALADARALMDGPEKERLERHAGSVAAALERLVGATGTPLIPVHGDLHVGQVLRGADGAYRVTDFDGNPVATRAERAASQPAALDVASMLQSLDHVGYVVLHRAHNVEETAVVAWRAAASAAFLAAYRDGLARADRTQLLDEQLIEPFRLRQVCREYVYAGRHLPHWRYVPDRAIAARYGEPPPPTGAGAHR